MSDSSPPVRGLVAAKYEVLGLIGRGGMGSVWEGRHHSLGTRVAIKFIDPEYAKSDDARGRFVTEARAAATIESKHAIQIFDHGVTDDGHLYMVMELLVGEPLDRRIDRLGVISLGETARIIGHVCRALQRAHDAGIIHRDLKPENIFLVHSPDGDEEMAKVLDFGIAKIKAPPGEEGLTSSTKTGAVLGTPYYMSPEQARGLRNLDHRTDLWSLGVIAHKCVTGVLPFEGVSVGDLLVKICTSPPPAPSARKPGLPAAFDAWFFRALEREPESRFGTASELAQALWLAAGLTPLRGPTSGSAERALATPRRPSRGALAAVVAAGMLGGSVGIAAVVKLANGAKTDVQAIASAPAPSRSVGLAAESAVTAASTAPRAAAGASAVTLIAPVAVVPSPSISASTSVGAKHLKVVESKSPRPPPAHGPASSADPGY